LKVHRNLNFGRGLAALVVLASFLAAPMLHAQSRRDNKDIEALMKNLREDSKAFRSAFEDDLKKSAIRKTSQEKDARQLASDFEKQTDEMLSDFKKTKRANVAVENTLNTAQELNKIVASLQVGHHADSQWQKIRSELQEISNAIGITYSSHM
jgi:cell division protein ZapA (FtsZ GTPase activity inhibitor)